MELKMLLASKYDQSRFLKAADLPSEKKLRIKNVSEESIGIGAEKEVKLVIWFTNDDRGLVLNRVNNRTLRGAFGDAVEGWTGKIVVLFPTTAEFRGKMAPALRVRIPPPKEAAGNGQPAATAKAKPAVSQQLDDVGSSEQRETEPKSAVEDDLNDEVPW